jgi:hypothetical protein
MFSVGSQGSVPEVIQRWPRWLRVAVACTAFVLTFIVLVPLMIAGGASFLGFNDCDSQTTARAWICTAQGRLFVALLILAILVPPGLKWARFLQGIASYRTDRKRIGEVNRPPHHRLDFVPSLRDLSLGLRLLSGEIISCRHHSHLVQVGGEELTFWSAYPFHAGWLKVGDQAHIAYQRVPFTSRLKIALAFSAAGSGIVRGVATREQIGALILAGACTWVFGWLVPEPRPALVALCAALSLVALVYLGLMIRAKAVVRRLVTGP